MNPLSRVQLFVTPWTVTYQAPLSMGFTGKSTGVGCHFLLQGIFPTQGSNPGLLHCRQMPYCLAIREAYINQLTQQIFIKHLLWAWNSVGTEDKAVNKPKSPPSRNSHWSDWKRCIKLLWRGAYLMAQTVKNPPAVQETQVWSLGWEDPLEKGMATHLENSMDRGAWWATV